jgi:hypothetical protein
VFDIEFKRPVLKRVLAFDFNIVFTAVINQSIYLANRYGLLKKSKAVAGI